MWIFIKNNEVWATASKIKEAKKFAKIYVNDKKMKVIDVNKKDMMKISDIWDKWNLKK